MINDQKEREKKGKTVVEEWQGIRGRSGLVREEKHALEDGKKME